MKKHLLTLAMIGILGISVAEAQKYKYDWMKMITFDKEMVDENVKIQADANGFTYTTFSFQWDIHLGRPPAKKKDPEPPILSAEGGIKGVYIDKRDSNGDPVWAKVVKIGNPDIEDEISVLTNHVSDLAISPTGDVYITGSFDGKADFGQGITLKSEGRNDMFIAKISSSGEAEWAVRAGGSGTVSNEIDPGGLSVTTDRAGNVFAVGGLNAYPKGGGTYGDGQPLELSEWGATTVLFKLSPKGEFLWFKKSHVGTFGSNNDLSTDAAGNIYLGGGCRAFAEWDGNKSEVNGLYDAVLFKLDNDGNHIWTKVWGWGDGEWDKKSMDAESISRMSVSDDGRVTMMLTLYNGAEINGVTIKTDKKNASNMETLAVNLDADGNVTNMTRFASKDSEQMIIGLPNALTPGFNGADGTIYFKIGPKVTINDEKLKGDGIYAIDKDGEITFLMSLVIKDIAPVHGFGPYGFTMNSKSELFGVGQVYKISDLVSQYAGAAAGKRIEKMHKKNYFYDRDFNQGIVITKYTN
ncbi:MAG: hypothetical protein RIF46_05785 [Cyclobacteriaceae bacterium]